MKGLCEEGGVGIGGEVRVEERSRVGEEVEVIINKHHVVWYVTVVGL